MVLDTIVAVDADWGIGRDNDLLFSIPEDMRFFRSTTLNSVVVLGKNNLMSFPGGKPLPKRRNIVLSTTLDEGEGYEVCRSIDELFELLQGENERKIFVIGGESVYRQLLPLCRYAYVTKMYKSFGAENYFPNLDDDKNWQIEESGELKEYEGLEFRYLRYKNTKFIDNGGNL